MSWAEVFKINSNLTKPLNTLISELISGVTTKITGVDTKVGTVDTKVTNLATQVGTVNTKLTQMRDSKIVPMKIITASTTYKPEKTGTYMIICVGEGGDGKFVVSNMRGLGGSAGGVAIKTMRLLSTTSYNVTVEGTSSFGTILSATAGGNSGGDGGTGTGGDTNYTGEIGESQETYTMDKPTRAGSVGIAVVGMNYHLNTMGCFDDGVIFTMPYGGNILGYGGGGSAIAHRTTVEKDDVGFQQSGLPGAVIIIPIEMEG